ncbi:MAG: response regulator transcription factor [Dehalococcoidia bacterium]|nr:response regulator transcription factor [Dehalococcoidia bacterium]
MRVFVVDDSPLVRERLVALLSEVEGVEVVGTADNADEGIDSIRKLKPDVAVLDIRMPSGSGIVILEAVKREEGCPCIIMLTNYPYPQYRKKCMDAGADYFFDKSSEFHKVTEVLAGMVQRESEASK